MHPENVTLHRPGFVFNSTRVYEQLPTHLTTHQPYHSAVH